MLAGGRFRVKLRATVTQALSSLAILTFPLALTLASHAFAYNQGRTVGVKVPNASLGKRLPDRSRCSVAALWWRWRGLLWRASVDARGASGRVWAHLWA